MYFQFHNSDWSNIKNVDEQEGWMTFWTSKDNVWSVQRSYLNQVRLDNVFILLLRHVCYVLLWSLSTSNCNNKRWTFEFLTFSHSDHRCLRQIRNKYFLQAQWILEQPINVQNDQSWSSFPTLLKEQSVPRSHKFCGHPFWGGRLPAAPEIPRRDFSLPMPWPQYVWWCKYENCRHENPIITPFGTAVSYLSRALPVKVDQKIITRNFCLLTFYVINKELLKWQ